jgi:hypothetical protein
MGNQDDRDRQDREDVTALSRSSAWWLLTTLRSILGLYGDWAHTPPG